MIVGVFVLGDYLFVFKGCLITLFGSIPICRKKALGPFIPFNKTLGSGAHYSANNKMVVPFK
jgi:hypothetical protein